jgi:hypothetical protein
MRVTFDTIASLLSLTRQAVFDHLHRLIHVKPIGRPKRLPPVLILDGLSTRHTETFTTEAKDRNIHSIFLVPYSSDQYQPLDSATYRVMKRFMSSGHVRFMPSDQSHKIVKILGAWHQAPAPHLVISAFAAMGLLLFMGRNNIVYLLLDRERATRIRPWGGQDPETMDVDEGGNRRIRLPTQ